MSLRALLLILAALLTGAGQASGWDRGTVAYGGPQEVRIRPMLADTVSHLLPRSEPGPAVSLRIANRRDTPVVDAFLYLGITDFAGDGVQDFALRLHLPANADTTVSVNMPALADNPGFYDVRALLFDSGRELDRTEFSFGYDAGGLDHDYASPDGFDRFWDDTLDSLAAVDPALTVMFDSSRSTAEVVVYRISFASLHGVRIHGWFTLPAWKPGPHAGIALYPGYSSGRISPALDWSRRGYATVSIQVRGYLPQQESYPEDNRRYMTIGCESPETYVYREIVCHCLRALDLLAARDDVDETRLATVGGSQGGGLSLLVAGLDSRVSAVLANVPFLTDFPRSMTMTGNPYRDLVRYMDERPGSAEDVMRTVRFFDTVSLAGRITCPVIVSAGMADRTCPAPSIYRMFLELGSTDKRIEVYPGLDHGDVGSPFMPVARNWLLDRLPPVAEPPRD